MTEIDYNGRGLRDAVDGRVRSLDDAIEEAKKLISHKEAQKSQND